MRKWQITAKTPKGQSTILQRDWKFGQRWEGAFGAAGLALDAYGAERSGFGVCAEMRWS